MEKREKKNDNNEKIKFLHKKKVKTWKIKEKLFKIYP